MFDDLDVASRRDLAERARESTWSAGEPILTWYDPPEILVAVIEGLAKMSGITRNGRERILHVYRPGELIGSRTLLENPSESEFSVAALTDVRGAVLTRQTLLAVGERHPEIMLDVSRELSHRIAELNHRLMEVMAVEVEVRLARLLLDFADVERDEYGDFNGFVPLSHPLTHRLMAQIVGASRPHVSAVLAEMEEEGGVKRRGARDLLVKPARLKEIVGEL